MSTTTASLIAEITATRASTFDDELSAAVDTAREEAVAEGRRGVLVTRRGYTVFTVELSPEVPFGLTQERQAY